MTQGRYRFNGGAAGNRLSRTETTPAGGNNTTQHVSNYSYDAIYQ